MTSVIIKKIPTECQNIAVINCGKFLKQGGGGGGGEAGRGGA